MLRILLATMLLACASSLYAGTQERVVNLPQDGDKLFVTVFGDTADCARITGWFNAVPELKAVKSRTHFNVYPTTGNMYQQRYAKSIKRLPTVKVQTADSDKLFQLSGPSLTTGEALAKHLNTGCIRRWGNCCPQQEAAPEPEPEVAVDDGDMVEPIEDKPSDLLLVGIVLVGMLAGSVVAFKDKVKSLVK